MAVFRVEKTKNYTIMSNYHLKDKSLTLKAKAPSEPHAKIISSSTSQGAENQTHNFRDNIERHFHYVVALFGVSDMDNAFGM